VNRAPGRQGLHVGRRDLEAAQPAVRQETQVADTGVLRAHGRRVREKLEWFTYLRAFLGAVYEFAYESAYDSVYDLVPKVDCNRIWDRFFLECIYKRL
jgi:hypothetical protein